jgi:hypothetical protein
MFIVEAAGLEFSVQVQIKFPQYPLPSGGGGRGAGGHMGAQRAQQGT